MFAQLKLLALAAIYFLSVHAIDVDTNNFTSVRSAAAKIAANLVDIYDGNEPGKVPGILGAQYFWWNGGMLFDVLIQYYNLTGDSQYNEIAAQALQFQVGENNDYLPANYTTEIGNDDQSTWALAALSAADNKLPADNVQYATLAENVFNTQVARWNDSVCGGGLRWQIQPFNLGYNYKNAFSNGNFIQLAARLAWATRNSTYIDWAAKAFKWSRDIGLIDDKWNVYDGAHVEAAECKDIYKAQFSAVAGTYLVGAATLYNVTGGASDWKDVVDGLLARTIEVFFPGGIATEVVCERTNSCNTDQKTLKGVFVRQLVDAVRAAPYIADKIRPVLISSAAAAAKACDANGDDCASNWNRTSSSDSELGPQLSALSIVQALLVWDGSAVGSGNATTTGQPSQSGSQTRPSSSGTITPLVPGNSAASFAPGCLIMVVAISLGFSVAI